MKKDKTIAVHIQNEVQFYSIEPVLGALNKTSYEITILIEKRQEDNDGWKEMSEGTIKLMNECGYKPQYTEDYKNKEFDLCLTPYADGLIKAKCILKYEYGGMRIKPRTTYTSELLSGFHGFLCTNEDEANIFSAYGKTFRVDSLRFLNKKHISNNKKKKIVLFAPTYNDDGSADDNTEIIKQLKKKYYVIVKSHHGTKYLKKNEKKKESLNNSEADESYGSEKNIIDLIMRADICLTGSSGVIADALYANVPCVVFAHDLDYFKWGNLHTIQYEMSKNQQLITFSDPKKVNNMITKGLTSKYKKQWHELGNRLVPKNFRTGVKGYLEVIEYFLHDPDAEKYVLCHDYYLLRQRDEIKLREEVINEMDRYIKALERERDDLSKTLDILSKKRLHQIADAIYDFGRRTIKKT